MSAADCHDPLSARDYAAAFKRAYKAWREGKLTAQHWKDIESAFEALEITFPKTRPHGHLAKQLLELGQAAARGEFEDRENGVLVMGDRAMEMAEQLYAYAEEREEA